MGEISHKAMGERIKEQISEADYYGRTQRVEKGS